MGKPGVPLYGEDLGSVVEAAEKVIAKIKSNRYSKKDILALVEVDHAILKYLLEEDYE